MSVNTNQVSVNKKDFFFLLANVSTLTAKNISTINIAAQDGTFSTLQTGTGSADKFYVNYISSGIADLWNVSTQYLEADYGFVSTMEVLAGNISSIITNNIVLDGNFLDTGGVGAGATLLLNGFPIVTGAQSSFSTLADWSYFPALSTVQMNSQNIANAGNITCQNIYNALNIQTDTANALTAITAPSGTITNLRTTNFSTVSAVGSNITVAQTLAASNISTGSIAGQRGTFGGLSSLTLSTGTLTAASINGQPYAPASNWSQYPASSAVNMNGYALTNTSGQTFSITPSSNLVITTSNNNLTANYPISMTAGDVNITANGGADVANITQVNIVASNGNRGQINLTANPGFAGVQGEIALTANGGTLGGVGFGGLITMTANTPIGLSNLTSAIKQSAAGINSYAGATPSFGSGAGYNFIHGDAGVNITSGLASLLPNTVGTTYIYGTAGVEIPSDAYMANIYPYWDGITTPPDLKIEGRYIIPNLAQVCVRMSNVKQIDFQSNVATYMSNCDNLAMSANGVITTSNLSATNGTIGTLSNTNLVGSGGTVSGYANGSFTTLSNTNLVGSGAGAISGYASVAANNITASNVLSTIALNISSINGFNMSQIVNGGSGGPTTNRFSTLFTSSFSFSTATSVGSNTNFNYPIFIDYDTAGNATTAGVAIAIQNHNFGTGAVINRLEMGARANGENYIMSVWPGQNLEDLIIDATQLTIRDSDGFSTIVNANPYGLQTNGPLEVQSKAVMSGSNLTISTINCSTINVSSVTGLLTVNAKDIYTFGEFLTTSTITVSAANTPTIIPFDTNTIGNQVSLSSGAIEVAQAGLYELKVSIQLDKGGGGTDSCDFWVRVNGNDVANTGSQITITGSQGETLGTCFYYLNLNANDTVEIAFASSDSTMAATSFPAWTTPGDPYDRPAIPAVIANIKLLR